MGKKMLVVDAIEGLDVLKGLASDLRIRMLKLLHTDGPQNMNEIAESLGIPQSTASSNLQLLIEANLIRVETKKAIKGNQKICHPTYDEILIAFKDTAQPMEKNVIDVAMPLGLYTSCEVTGPCGLCSPEGIIGLLDVPETFMDPERMSAGLIWFTRGYVEYQFPNNAKLKNKEVGAIEFDMELSSEVPGTSSNWPSDISVVVNGVNIGSWTSPGDFGDKRGVYTPDWWKLEGSQYGKLKSWRIGQNGSYVDGMKISNVTVDDLQVSKHRSIRLRIGVDQEAEHPGGINIFGKGFGNYDQDIVMRLHTK